MTDTSYFNMPTKFETERLILVRRCHEYDVRLSYIIAENFDFLQQHLTWPKYEKTYEEIVKSTATMLKLWDDRKQYSYLITDKNNTVLGAIDVANINLENKSVEIGYWLSKDQTGNGYVTEALKKLETYIFSTDITSIILECEENNIASIRLAEHCGYHINKMHDHTLIYTKGK